MPKGPNGGWRTASGTQKKLLLSVAASRPATGAAHPLLELLLGATDSALARLLLLRIFHPTDELVTGQRRDVLPDIERHLITEERSSQVDREFVNHSSRNSLTSHRAKIAPGGSEISRRCRQQRNRATAGREARCRAAERSWRSPPTGPAALASRRTGLRARSCW